LIRKYLWRSHLDHSAIQSSQGVWVSVREREKLSLNMTKGRYDSNKEIVIHRDTQKVIERMDEIERETNHAERQNG